MKRYLVGLALAALTIGVAYAGGKATATWTAPTTYTDGTPLPATDIKEYKVYEGTAPRTYTYFYTVPSASPRQIVLTMPTGTFYFAVTTVSKEGAESDYSNELSKYFPRQTPGNCVFTWQ